MPAAPSRYCPYLTCGDVHTTQMQLDITTSAFLDDEVNHASAEQSVIMKVH